MMLKRIHFLNTSVDSLTMEESVKRVREIIRAGKPMQHVVVNAAKIVSMQTDAKLREIVNSCELINADGQAVVWAAKVLGHQLPERVAGIDLMHEVIKLAAAEGYRVYFFGAKDEVVTKVVETLKVQYPALQVAGYRHGYFTEEDNGEIIAGINAAMADIIFLGFSSPKKEYWLAEHLHALRTPFCMGVGGSFDVIAGVTQRAPLWMQKAGLEWFYRFSQEPGRLWRRYLVGNSKFLALVLKEKLRGGALLSADLTKAKETNRRA